MPDVKTLSNREPHLISFRPEMLCLGIRCITGIAVRAFLLVHTRAYVRFIQSSISCSSCSSLAIRLDVLCLFSNEAVPNQAADNDQDDCRTCEKASKLWQRPVHVHKMATAIPAHAPDETFFFFGLLGFDVDFGLEVFPGLLLDGAAKAWQTVKRRAKSWRVKEFMYIGGDGSG